LHTAVTSRSSTVMSDIDRYIPGYLTRCPTAPPQKSVATAVDLRQISALASWVCTESCQE